MLLAANILPNLLPKHSILNSVPASASTFGSVQKTIEVHRVLVEIQHPFLCIIFLYVNNNILLIILLLASINNNLIINAS